MPMLTSRKSLAFWLALLGCDVQHDDAVSLTTSIPHADAASAMSTARTSNTTRRQEQKQDRRQRRRLQVKMSELLCPAGHAAAPNRAAGGYLCRASYPSQGVLGHWQCPRGTTLTIKSQLTLPNPPNI